MPKRSQITSERKRMNSKKNHITPGWKVWISKSCTFRLIFIWKKTPAANLNGNRNVASMICHYLTWLTWIDSVSLENVACGWSQTWKTNLTRVHWTSPNPHQISQEFTGDYRNSPFIGTLLINSIDFQSNGINIWSVRLVCNLPV